MIDYQCTEKFNCLGMSSKVDVVVPVFNGEELVDRCLDSVLSQTVPPANVIVVNDGSTDRSSFIIKNYIQEIENVQLVETKNQGPSAARNLGCSYCRSDFIAFIDVDDAWVANKLERQLVQFSDRDSQLGLVHAGTSFMDKKGSSTRGGRTELPKVEGDVYSQLVHQGNLITGSASSVLIPRHVFYEVGGFDESLDYGEDWDLWLRIAKKYQVAYCSESLVRICEYPESSQRRLNSDLIQKRFQQKIEILKKHSNSLCCDKYFWKKLYKESYFVWKQSGYSLCVLSHNKRLLADSGIADRSKLIMFYPKVVYRLFLSFFKLRTYSRALTRSELKL